MDWFDPPMGYVLSAMLGWTFADWAIFMHYRKKKARLEVEELEAGRAYR